MLSVNAFLQFGGLFFPFCSASRQIPHHEFIHVLTGKVVDKQTCTLVNGATSNGCKEVVPDGGYDFFAPAATQLPVVHSR